MRGRRPGDGGSSGVVGRSLEMDASPGLDSLPGAFRVTGWVAPNGLVTLELDALRIMGVGATQAAAQNALIAEIRDLIGRWRTEPRLRRSSRWEHRGVIVELLATITDAEIGELFDIDMGGHPGLNVDQRYSGYTDRSGRPRRRG